LNYYQKAVELKEEIYSISSQKNALKQKMAYDHQVEKDKLQLTRKAEKKSENQRTFFILIALGLILIIALVLYSRFKTARKQKNIIEAQKFIVEEKNKEITDSINYAKYLQSAILPEKQNLFADLKDGFLLYQPKDIVAGDFYWKHKFGDFIYFAVADCTGHGVPGALVSVVCFNALEKAIHEKPGLEPSVLLERVREIVINQFETEETEVKDGMDIALIRIDVKKHELLFSGANNPCWIRVKNEWKMLKGDRQPIGKFDYAKPFEKQKTKYESGDWVYLFTDGLIDQFGGLNGKKLKNKGLQEILVQLDNLSGTERQMRLNQLFIDWKNNLDQIDDVCLIGIELG
jgi:serine phosphatase RsbU (regulator of sigma subunit)